MPRKLVYFARALGSDLVKIGITGDPKKRLSDIQTGCPQSLRMEGALPGGREIEAMLHEHLKHRHARGEWYSLTTDEVSQLCQVHRHLAAVGPKAALPVLREHIERIAADLP